MKHSMNTSPVSRPEARYISVSNAVFNHAQKLYALRFYLFAYFFTPLPIRRNCS